MEAWWLRPATSQMGDVLVAVFEMPSYPIDGVSQIPAGSELTGIAVIQIDTIVGNTVTFVPYDGGFNAVSPVDVTDGDAGDGAMVAMWVNGTGGGADANLNLDFATAPAASCTSLRDCLTQASLGSLVQVDGFAGDLDEFWSSTGLIGGAFNTTTVLGLGGAINVALFNSAMTTFFNSTGGDHLHERGHADFPARGALSVLTVVSQVRGLQARFKAGEVPRRSMPESSRTARLPAATSTPPSSKRRRNPELSPSLVWLWPDWLLLGGGVSRSTA